MTSLSEEECNDNYKNLSYSFSFSVILTIKRWLYAPKLEEFKAQYQKYLEIRWIVYKQGKYRVL